MSERTETPTAGTETATDGDRATTAAEPAADLPAVTAVRPHAGGGESVVVGLANEAALRFRAVDADGDRGESEGTDGDDATVRETVVGPDGATVGYDREGDPERVALRAVGAYLSFGSRARAAFVWGEERVATLSASASESAGWVLAGIRARTRCRARRPAASRRRRAGVR